MGRLHHDPEALKGCAANDRRARRGVLGCGGLVSLVYGLGEAGTSGWGAPTSSLALILAGVLLAAFILVAEQGDPIHPPRCAFLRNRNRAGSFLTIMLAVTGMFGTFLFLTYLLQTIDHYSASQDGRCLPPPAGSQRAGGDPAGQPPDAARADPSPGGARPPAVGRRCRPVHHSSHPGASYVTHVLPSEILLGIGSGARRRALHQHSHPETPNPKDVGVTSAMTNTSQQIGASIGTALLNTIAAATTATYLATHAPAAHELATATVHGYATASAWAAGIFVLAAVIAGVLINVNPGQQLREAADA